MEIKINKESKFLAGKIKFWEQPIFDLDKIRKLNYELRNYLNKKLNLLFNPCFNKPPNRNTILGEKKETYRFDFVQLPNENDFIEHLEVGFGEIGYYYDIYLKNFELNIKNWNSFIDKIDSFKSNLEKKIETLLEDIYIKKDGNLLNNKNNKNCTISNFSLALETGESHKFKNEAISSFFNIISQSKIRTENFFFENKNQKNILIPEYILRIFPEKMFDSPIYSQKIGKHLKLERFFKISPLDIKKNLWEIQARGITFKSTGDIFEKLFL